MLRRMLLLSLLLAGACANEGRDPRSLPVARVDGVPIPAGELLAALAAEGLGQVEPAVQRRALEELVERRLLGKAARERGLRVEDREIERALARLQADYPDDRFAEMLAAQGIELEALRERLRESLLVQRLFVAEVVARVAVTDDEVAAWLEANEESLRRPAQVRAAQIVVRTEDEARRIHGELQRGASFEELAQAHSLSPDARKGGDLGFFARGEMPPPFDEVCFGLAPGQISDVVSSSYGFHVFKLLERRGAESPDAARMRIEAERRIRREKEAAAQQAFVASLRSRSDVRIDEAALARLLGNP